MNPDLVVRDEDGKVYTVRYEAVNAMLLNEFLKEHRKVEEQAAIAEQQRHQRGKEESGRAPAKADRSAHCNGAESERASRDEQTCAASGRQYSLGYCF